jgi:putative zinc finger/helix-turn-helix YgiT family protein
MFIRKVGFIMRSERIHSKNELIYECPFCDTSHPVKLLQRNSKMLIKNRAVDYLETYCFCPKEGEEFVPSFSMDENLLNVRDAYRRTENLLTSVEIKSIRQKYGITQKELSNILGWGDITIQRYEKKLIQDETYDKILRVFSENPAFALESLDKHKISLEPGRYIELRNLVKSKIKEDRNIALKIQEIKNLYVEFEEQSDSNGYKPIDIEKVSKIMAFFANYVIPLYKVKLMKLLWYTDALYFKRHGTSMTGLVYQHYPLGALPIAYNEMLSLPSIKVEEEYFNDYTAYNIKSNGSITLDTFLFDELSVLQSVLSFFKNKNTDTIVNYMHGETAYIATSQGQIIPYSLAKEIRDLATA